MKHRLTITVPGTEHIWLALKPDDVDKGSTRVVSHHLKGGYIEYLIEGEGAGEVKSLANDVLRCYAAVTNVEKELSMRAWF